MLIAGYATHPAADLFPLLSEAEIRDLAADVQAHGLIQPIVLWRGQLLDGRNRLRACDAAGVTPRFETFDGDEADAVRHVVSLNLKRRHLNASQRAMVATGLANLEHGANQHEAKMDTEISVSTPAVTQAEAAKLLNVSVDSVQFARVVAQRAAPEIAAKVKAGELAVSAAAVIATAPQAEQRQIAALSEKEILAAAKGIRERRAETRRTEARRDLEDKAVHYVAGSQVDIRHADCFDMIASLADGSVSLLLTDPPYNVTANEWDTFKSPAEFWGFMRRWLTAMRPKMAADFTSFVFCDADATHELARALEDTGWPVLRQAIWNRRNLAKKRSGSMTFLSSYEPFWHCGTRPLAFPDVWGDERFDVQTFAVPQSTHVEDRAVHPTQKPLALFQRLVELGAYRGELVVDPFCGAGTTAVACNALGRRCITSDTSEEYVRIARGRMAGGERAA